MKKNLSYLAIAAAVIVSATPLMAQQKRLSPHETVSTVVGGDRVMIVYGRPYTTKPGTTEARKIWGGLVPYDKVWRAGADEATMLICQKPIMIGDTSVPAGAYTLFLLPKADGSAKLVISKDVGQWGEEYTEGDDLARVDLNHSAGGGFIKLSWENAEYSVAFTVPK